MGLGRRGGYEKMHVSSGVFVVLYSVPEAKVIINYSKPATQKPEHDGDTGSNGSNVLVTSSELTVTGSPVTAVPACFVRVTVAKLLVRLAF